MVNLEKEPEFDRDRSFEIKALGIQLEAVPVSQLPSHSSHLITLLYPTSSALLYS